MAINIYFFIHCSVLWVFIGHVQGHGKITFLPGQARDPLARVWGHHSHWLSTTQPTSPGLHLGGPSSSITQGRCFHEGCMGSTGLVDSAGNILRPAMAKRWGTPRTGWGDQWGVSAMVLTRATGGLRSLKLCWLPPWNLVRRLIEGPVSADTATGWRVEGVPSTCIGSKLKGLDSSGAKVRQSQELGADLSTSRPGRSLMGFSPPTNITG